MKQLLFLVLLIIIPVGVHAEKGQSIMFDKPTPDYVKSTKDKQSEEHARHCKELSRQVEALKGKPQRRFAASERYKRECQTSSP